MTTEILAPASPPSGVEQFLANSLATLTPATGTPAASATTDETKPSADAAPASPAPSGGDSPAESADAPPSKLEAVLRQLTDQTKANKKLGRSNVDLQQKVKDLTAKLQQLQQKVEGTYVDAPGPTPEQQQALMEFQARESASRKVAEEQYGADTIHAKIYAEDAPYRQLIAEYPWLHHRVLTSDTPILEALQALEEMEVLSTYGRSAPAVLENVTQQVKEQLWKQWTQQQQTAKDARPGGAVHTLGDARGQSDVGGATKPVATFSPATFNRHIL